MIMSKIKCPDCGYVWEEDMENWESTTCRGCKSEFNYEGNVITEMYESMKSEVEGELKQAEDMLATLQSFLKIQEAIKVFDDSLYENVIKLIEREIVKVSFRVKFLKEKKEWVK